MPIVPMKELCIATEPGEVDAWGNSTGENPITYKCRIKEGTKLVRNQSGAEVVSNTRILLDKAVVIKYDYDVTYTDATGEVVTRKPIAIRFIKNISSKVILTEVSL